MAPLLSIIVLSYNSHLTKSNAVLTCLWSILLQKFERFEIIVVENSTDKTNLTNIYQILQQNQRVGLSFQVLNLPQQENKGKARNEGASLATSDNLVFIDDDTIVLDNKALQYIYQLSLSVDFACGATRFWTVPEWDSAINDSLINELKHTRHYHSFKHPPPPFVRGQKDVEVEKISFIGNFGYCRKQAFDNVGKFPVFLTGAFEDDALLFTLAIHGYRFASLKSVEVLHICHDIQENRLWDYYRYLSILMKKGYFSFDTAGFIHDSKFVQQHLTLLRTLHMHETIEAAYAYYCDLLPLNISADTTSESIYWKKQYQLSLQDFSRTIARLLQAKSIDLYFQEESADFDNLAPVLKAALAQGILQIKEDGGISVGLEDIKHPYLPLGNAKPLFEPHPSLNQFPCDATSLQNRLQLLKERYPFCEYLTIALIGDDDFFSCTLTNEPWVFPLIIEKDPVILEKIKALSGKGMVAAIDLQSKHLQEALEGLPFCHTFICDPPYTKAGLLLFVFAGLNRIVYQEQGPMEFYVVANRMMLGKTFFDICHILSSCGIFLYETKAHFSHYPFPKDYAERTRAQDFLSSMGVEYAPTVSSTSDLFIFRTHQPDLAKLKGFLTPELIYDHFK